MQITVDNISTLCEFSFDIRVRSNNGENPDIKSIERVECPEEIILMTQIVLTNDPLGYNCGSSCKLAIHECELNNGGQSLY